jgi:hypothetical protein
MGNWKNLPHHEELTRHTNMMKNQFTEKKLLRRLPYLRYLLLPVADFSGLSSIPCVSCRAEP